MTTMFLIIEDKIPNKDGKQHFWLQWYSEQVGYNKNEVGYFTQYFFGHLEQHTSFLVKKGVKIIEKEKVQIYPENVFELLG